MLGLGEEIRGDPLGVGRIIRDNEDLARARQKIDGDVPEDLALCFDHIRVSRSKDFLDRPDGFRSEGQGGDRLGPANPMDFGGAAGGERADQIRRQRVQVITAVETRGALPPGT